MPSPVTMSRNGTVLRTVRVAVDVPAVLVIVDGRVTLEEGRDDTALSPGWAGAAGAGMIDEGVAQRLSLSTRTVRRRSRT